ncbi:TonB-dependent receptor [Myxococcus sp. AM001]|nr:TonB-dependent receptor [Myxococcus sp. AM001]
MSQSVLRVPPRFVALSLVSFISFATPALARQTEAPAQAEPVRTVAFSISPGDLNTGLLAFAEASGLKLVFDPAPMSGRTTPGVSGTLTVREGLTRLLAGTGFGFRLTADTATLIAGAPAEQAPASAPTPAADDTEVYQLSGITVTDDALRDEDSYAPPPSSVATKTELPVRQTPFTINQVTEEIIRERGDVNIFETLEGFAGVSTVSSNADIGQGISRSINVRGMDLAGSGQVLVNGQRSYSLGSQNRNADNLERVELLRGPAGLYYGASQPGGIINYVYKRPQDKARYQLLARTDSAVSYGGTLDLTGPLTKDGTLLYRAVGNYSRYQDDQDNIFSNPISGMGAVTWKPSSEFTTNLTYEYYRFSSVPEQENNRLDAVTGEYFPVPRDFFFGSTNDRANRDSHTVVLSADWRPSERVKVAAYTNFQRSDQWYQNTRVVGGGRNGVPSSADPEGNVPRYISLSPDNEYNNISAGMDLSGRLDTWGVRHDWLLGGGAGLTRTRSAAMPPDIACLYGQGTANTATCPAPLEPRSLAPPDVNLFDPDYSEWGSASLREQGRFMVPFARRADYNLYLQDVATLPNGSTRLMAAVGWSRFDNLGRGSYNWATGQRGADTRSVASAWTPRLAVMQDLGDSSTVYASYGQSFNPQASLTLVDEDGQALLDPERGVQYEVGFKRDFFDGEGLLQVSLFRIDKKNVARAANVDTCDPNLTDPDDEGFCYSTLDGLQRSDGGEVELSGNLTSWWSGSIGYSYLQAEVVESNDLPNLGKQLPYIPRHSLSLWTRFRIHEWSNGSRLGLGGGVRAYSSVTNGYDAEGLTDVNPAYALVNVGAFYSMPLSTSTLKLSLNVNNLLNQTYYDRRRYATSGTIVYGNERRAFLTAEFML